MGKTLAILATGIAALALMIRMTSDGRYQYGDILVDLLFMPLFCAVDIRGRGGRVLVIWCIANMGILMIWGWKPACLITLAAISVAWILALLAFFALASWALGDVKTEMEDDWY